MKRLILIRHCKSSWNFDGNDHDRPLNGRGRRSATALGRWMESQGLAPDLWLVSTAARAQATAAGIRDALPSPGEKRDVRELYMAMPERIITIAKQAQAEVLAIVGHNPGIGITADQLATERADHPRFCDYPTGAVTVLDFDGELGRGAGRIAHFVIPRELMEKEPR